MSNTKLISLLQFTKKYELPGNMFYKRVVNRYEGAPEPNSVLLSSITGRPYNAYDEDELIQYLERVPLKFNRKKKKIELEPEKRGMKAYKVLSLINTRLNIDLNPSHGRRKKLIEKEKNKRRFKLDKLNKQRPFRTKNFFTDKEKYTEKLRPTYIQYLDSITHNAETHVISHNERY